MCGCSVSTTSISTSSCGSPSASCASNFLLAESISGRKFWRRASTDTAEQQRQGPVQGQQCDNKPSRNVCQRSSAARECHIQSEGGNGAAVEVKPAGGGFGRPASACKFLPGTGNCGTSSRSPPLLCLRSTGSIELPSNASCCGGGGGGGDPPSLPSKSKLRWQVLNASGGR